MLTKNSADSGAQIVLALQGERTAAARDGDYKYLKILDNTFLFNVVEDPMERANLKVRRKDVYDRIVAEMVLRECDHVAGD